MAWSARVRVLSRPSQGQQFIYTSPLGGMNLLFSVCLYLGLVLGTPVIVYEVLAFIRPLMRGVTRRFVAFSAIAAFAVALAGIAFGYFIGLPSALHFLLHQFQTVQVRPIITIQSYMSFVGVYLLGSALMFQLPLIVVIINRITPLTPGGMLRHERHVAIVALIAAFIMNPTPNLIDQAIVVVPLILSYQLSVGLVWFLNRPSSAADPRTRNRWTHRDPVLLHPDRLRSPVRQSRPARRRHPPATYVPRSLPPRTPHTYG